MNTNISKLEQENQRLRDQLNAITTSKAYKLGLTARLTLHDPKRAARKALLVAKGGPKGFINRMKSASKNVLSYQSSSMILDADYQEWMRWNDPTEHELAQQRVEATKFKKRPVISIITPVFKPPTDVLEELIQSVLNQTYPYFELCMAEVANHEPSQELIKKYAAMDKRIKLKIVKDNGGISKDSNQCLTLATGDYVALLDHDDLLSPNALFENVKLINSDDYDFIYSDKDKITADGRRYEPLFKPEWSPEIMLNANYLTHLNVFKRSLIQKIGGWNYKTDGAQDWDLFFRLIHESKKVGHINKVLYHWRVIETSTAHSILTKPYALEGQRNAIAEFANNNGLSIKPKHDVHGVLSVEWEHPKNSTVILLIEDGTQQITEKTLDYASSKLGVSIHRISATNPEGLFNLISEAKDKNKNSFLLHGSLLGNLDTQDIGQLEGWLSINAVGAVTPHILDEENLVIDMGRILGYRSAFGALFSGLGYMPHVFGYKEWIRNVSTGSPYATLLNHRVLDKELLKQAKSLRPGTVYDAFWAISVCMRNNGMRTVSTPYVELQTAVELTANEPAPSFCIQEFLSDKFPHGDGLFNSNLSLIKPGPRLITEIESQQYPKILSQNYTKGFIGLKNDVLPARAPSIPPDMQRDALVLSSTYTFTRSELKRNFDAISKSVKIDVIQDVIWFIPEFQTLYAGLKNIFALADLLTRTEGSAHTFVFQYGTTSASIDIMRRLVQSTFPSLKNAKYLTLSPQQDESTLPNSDVAICTLWTTAYNLLRYNNTKRKCYIIQDWEPSFYPKGTISSIAEATYSFGFTGLAGTNALSEMYMAYKKGNHSYVVPSLLDLSIYLKNSESKNKEQNIKRVMFYGRPDSPRNAFELGINALTGLKKQYGDSVEIVVAGSVFDDAMYDFDGRGITLAGKVPYDRLAQFYSSFDACLFLMYSEHPGVVPLEMMASGVPVVVNSNHNAEWDTLYIDEKTCLRALSSATDIQECITRILEDAKLNKQLIKNGESLAADYTDSYYFAAASKTITELKRKS